MQTNPEFIKLHLQFFYTKPPFEALHFIAGETKQEMEASVLEDNEENTVRLAEQMVREAFKKFRKVVDDRDKMV